VILLLCEVQAKDQVIVDAVGGQVESCRRSLQAMEPVWPGSRKLKDLLNDVERKAKEVAVVGKEVNKAGKKRKSSGHMEMKGQMGPPQVKPPSTTWQYSTSPGGAASIRPGSAGGIIDGTKRPRVEMGRYEMSDTRTFVDDQASMSASTNQLSQAQLNQLLYPPPSIESLVAPQQSTFDVNGVTFDGLDMLQGFTATDSSNFWETFLNPQYLSSVANSPIVPQLPAQGGNAHLSGQNTPTSTPGIGHGPSPVSGGIGWNVNGNGNGLGEGMGMGLGVGMDGLDFWSQVGEGRFDWGADPSVPFNV
jgi:hypothetical protein